jgi:hypothetical protein
MIYYSNGFTRQGDPLAVVGQYKRLKKLEKKFGGQTELFNSTEPKLQNSSGSHVWQITLHLFRLLDNGNFLFDP